MRRITRRDSLRTLASLSGLGSVGAALREANAATPASGTTQRITRYEIVPVRVPMHERIRDVFAEAYRKQGIFRDYYDSTLVKLYTDEGLVGVGDALLNVEDSLGSVPRAEAICKKLVGHSPWEFLLDDSLGGILMAVYDLVGQASGLPVSRLFAPKPRKRIVQTWWSQCLPPDVMASEAKLGYELGYRVHKVKARPFEDAIEQAEAITSAVPPGFRIWADANWTLYSVGRAIEFAERLSRFPQYFAIESPCHRASVEHYRQLKDGMPIAVAEHIPDDPMPFIREGLLGALVVGGPIGKTMVQRALMAEVTGVPLWVEHSIITGVAQVFQAHQTAAFPGVEYAISITHVTQDDLMIEPFEMKNGRYEVPTKPGLGVHFDDEAVDKYRIA
ncbi:MAG: mandelate racemase/muconate lactonizing enzyme family protein [Acidobacteria bacterium]|nr:mandelate racemase/muconate lactonizing enzyme family protein [Acidobacteriota bacterium]